MFNVLFLIALIVPLAMYVAGVLMLMLSIVLEHYRHRFQVRHSGEALVH
jgi:hypothetical protein